MAIASWPEKALSEKKVNGSSKGGKIGTSWVDNLDEPALAEVTNS